MTPAELALESSLPDVRVHGPIQLQDEDAIWPDVAARGHQAWAAWTQASPDGERIRLASIADGGIRAVHDLSEVRPIACQVSLGVAPQGHVQAVWVEADGGAWRLMGAQLREDGRVKPTEFWSSKTPLGAPRLVVDAEGTSWVALEAREATMTRVITLRRSADGAVSVHEIPSTGPLQRPAITLHDGGVWVAYDGYGIDAYRSDGYSSDGHGVRVARVDIPSDPIVVAADGYQNLQPSIVSDGEGLWIAWASNRDDQIRDPWWLTKWFRVARLNAHGVLVPIAAPLGRDLHREDSFQGFELPSIAHDQNDRVWVFGQAAHVLYAQRLDANGWSPLADLSERHWGSWKPQARAVGDGPLHLVTMGLGGAEYRQIEAQSPLGAPDRERIALRAPEPPRQPRPTHRERGERPLIAAPEGGPYAVYFGDLHAHTVFGDATSQPDEIYRRYRDGYGYDFACLTEHDYLDGLQLAPSELATLWTVADQMTVDGRFVAFRGYEWTAPAIAEHAGEGGAVGEGHRHVIYPGAGEPIVRYGDGATSGRALLDGLVGAEAVVIAHHTGWSGTDWDAFDERLQPVVEVCSAHGRFEYAGNQPIGHRRDHVWPDRFVLNALERGYKLGFVGGSDSHGLRWHGTELDGRSGTVPAGTRVGWKEDAYRTGMTAIIATGLSRAELYAALQARRCYATSGVPIVLDVRLDAVLMGGETIVTRPPELHVRVRGTAPLRAIEVVRSGHVWSALRFDHGASAEQASFTLRDASATPGESHYYYVRVAQDDGNMAWSSPIWARFASG